MQRTTPHTRARGGATQAPTWASSCFTCWSSTCCGAAMDAAPSVPLADVPEPAAVLTEARPPVAGVPRPLAPRASTAATDPRFDASSPSSGASATDVGLRPDALRRLATRRVTPRRLVLDRRFPDIVTALLGHARGNLSRLTTSYSIFASILSSKGCQRPQASRCNTNCSS